ncbi:hypothetical protein [Christiangramia sabulilitoris]|uniref:Uncharacterized protein n=1 Tax=Christiangramia sabulilitoris TaxID=2583991 RepID=A0A550HZJ0_9FLAO|nr:hypothetical protein [Christiangramia sabulilitoris]TRO64143.1 hypothetical protein FGM01_11590 [Christiangramia sabulilitoris]
MKRLSILASLLIIGSASLTSCRDTQEKETIVRTVEVEKEVEAPREVEEKEGILERTAKKVDKKVNEEIDEEIDKIGDDN